MTSFVLDSCLMLCLYTEKNYVGKNIALPSFGTKCYASLELQVKDCFLNLNNNSCIALSFITYHNIQRIDVYRDCQTARKSSYPATFTFSDGTTSEVSRTLNILFLRSREQMIIVSTAHSLADKDFICVIRPYVRSYPCMCTPVRAYVPVYALSDVEFVI